METDSEAGPPPARRPPGRVAGQGPGRTTPGPRDPAEHGRDESPPVHLTADRQPVAVLENLLIARGDRLLRAAIMLAGGHADGEDAKASLGYLSVPLPHGFTGSSSGVPTGKRP